MLPLIRTRFARSHEMQHDQKFEDKSMKVTTQIVHFVSFIPGVQGTNSVTGAKKRDSRHNKEVSLISDSESQRDAEQDDDDAPTEQGQVPIIQ